uniref:hypothetical protein n=1 Tax=Agrococcus jejuensis TaxID=399736 RepID=UPI001C931410
GGMAEAWNGGLWGEVRGEVVWGGVLVVEGGVPAAMGGVEGVVEEERVREMMVNVKGVVVWWEEEEGMVG